MSGTTKGRLWLTATNGARVLVCLAFMDHLPHGRLESAANERYKIWAGSVGIIAIHPIPFKIFFVCVRPHDRCSRRCKLDKVQFLP